MDEKEITVSYLAKLSGVSAQVIWKDVKLLQSIKVGAKAQATELEG